MKRCNLSKNNASIAYSENESWEKENEYVPGLEDIVGEGSSVAPSSSNRVISSTSGGILQLDIIVIEWHGYKTQRRMRKTGFYNTMNLSIAMSINTIYKEPIFALHESFQASKK